VIAKFGAIGNESSGRVAVADVEVGAVATQTRRSGAVGQGVVDERDESYRVARASLELLGPEQDLGLSLDDEDARQPPLHDGVLLWIELVTVPELQRLVERLARSVEVTATSDPAVGRLAQRAVCGATDPAERVLQLTA
jgi:hypothetical protein